MPELKAALTEVAKNLQRGNDIFETRLAIDRSFSVKGFGAVATGTLASGQIAEGDELELLPEGRKLRVRGVQTYGTTVDAARAGQRPAVISVASSMTRSRRDGARTIGVHRCHTSFRR